MIWRNFEDFLHLQNVNFVCMCVYLCLLTMLITGKWNIIINMFKHGKNTTIAFRKEYCKNQCDADRVISPQTGCMRNKFHGTWICLEKTSPSQILGNTRLKFRRLLCWRDSPSFSMPMTAGGEHHKQYFLSSFIPGTLDLWSTLWD